MIDIREVKDFFFRAMLRGWITNEAIMLPDPNNPGFKTIIIKEDDLQLVDSYCTVKGSNISAGHTIIRHRDVPVWIMQYGGWYAKRAIPLVKEALTYAYESQDFWGGRGRALTQGDLAYTNYPDRRQNEFALFSGYEYVRLPNGLAMGYQRYSGMRLPKNPF